MEEDKSTNGFFGTPRSDAFHPYAWGTLEKIPTDVFNAFGYSLVKIVFPPWLRKRKGKEK